MKSATFSTVALAAVLARAQNTTFLDGLVTALQSAGLTELVTVAAAVNGTSVGQSLLTNLTSGNAYTIFAPDNDAWSSVSSNVTSNVTTLADIFAYHVIPGNLANFSSCYPNVTLARTLYDDPLTVHLEGGKPQVVAWAVRGDDQTHVLNQPDDAIVQWSVTYGNITVLAIDDVLNVPGNLTATIRANRQLAAGELVLKNATLSFYNTTTKSTRDVTFFHALNAGYHGFTLFYPNNAAIGAANSTFASLASNRTALNDVLFNHIINGTSVYSPFLQGSQEYTTTAGDTLSFSVNSTGQYVTRGNITARIVQPDVLLSNGVIHIIDSVLVDTENDPPAASSALSSALAAATASEPAQTAPIGYAITSSLAAAASSAAASESSYSTAAPASSTHATSTTAVGGGSTTATASGSGSSASGSASTTAASTASTTSFESSAGATTSTSTASDGSVVTIVTGGAGGGTTTLSGGATTTTTVSSSADAGATTTTTTSTVSTSTSSA